MDVRVIHQYGLSAEKYTKKCQNRPTITRAGFAEVWCNNGYCVVRLIPSGGSSL
jgi:hypothetical protein